MIGLLDFGKYILNQIGGGVSTSTQISNSTKLLPATILHEEDSAIVHSTRGENKACFIYISCVSCLLTEIKVFETNAIVAIIRSAGKLIPGLFSGIK